MSEKGIQGLKMRKNGPNFAFASTDRFVTPASIVQTVIFHILLSQVVA